jgi:hypothetical protein
VNRVERGKAINAVRAFIEEAHELVADLPEGEANFLEIGAPLHVQLYLSLVAGPSIASAVAHAAQKHGLACYDPQSDVLKLPPARGSKAQKISLATRRPTVIPGEMGLAATLGPWTIRGYPETTRRFYEGIDESGSNRCECANCKNFALTRDQAYPAEILIFLDSLGVDFRKESEVHHYGRTPTGLHTYRGWLYLAGSIDAGPEAWHHPPNGPPEKRFYRIGPGFEIGLGLKTEYGFADWETVLIDAGFADVPCVEVDFYADLPWLIDAPEPDSPVR